MRAIKTAIILLLLCFFMLLTGCIKKVSDVNQNYAQTRYYLGLWPRYIKTCNDAGLPIEKSKNIYEAVELLEKYKIISKGESTLFLSDGWRREYHWSVRQESGHSVIRIHSCGKDGINQNGGGDDLVAEVTIGNVTEDQMYKEGTGLHSKNATNPRGGNVSPNP